MQTSLQTSFGIMRDVVACEERKFVCLDRLPSQQANNYWMVVMTLLVNEIIMKIFIKEGYKEPIVS
jgi:hypothetical protein